MTSLNIVDGAARRNPQPANSAVSNREATDIPTLRARMIRSEYLSVWNRRKTRYDEEGEPLEDDDPKNVRKAKRVFADAIDAGAYVHRNEPEDEDGVPITMWDWFIDGDEDTPDWFVFWAEYLTRLQLSPKMAGDLMVEAWTASQDTRECAKRTEARSLAIYLEVGPTGPDDNGTRAKAKALLDSGTVVLDGDEWKLQTEAGLTAIIYDLARYQIGFREAEQACRKRWVASGRKIASGGASLDLYADMFGELGLADADPGIFKFHDEGRLFVDVPGGYIAVLYGAPSVGKSGLMLTQTFDMLKAGKRVVYACGEGAQGMLNLRVPAMARLHDVALSEAGKGLHLMAHVPQLGNRAQVDAFIAACRKLNPAMVVIDTFASATVGENERGNQMAAHLTGEGAIGRIAKAVDCLVVVLAHPDAEDSHLRGHSGQIGNPDTVLHMRRDGGMMSVTVEKHRDAPAGDVVWFQTITVEGSTVPLPQMVVVNERLTDWGAKLVEHGINTPEAGLSHTAFARLLTDPEDAAAVKAMARLLKDAVRRDVGGAGRLGAKVGTEWRWFNRQSQGEGC